MVLTTPEQFVQLAGELHELRDQLKRAEDQREADALALKTAIAELRAQLTAPRPVPKIPEYVPPPPEKRPIMAWETFNAARDAVGVNAPHPTPDTCARLVGGSDISGTTRHANGTYSIPGQPGRFYRDGTRAPHDGLPEPQPIGAGHGRRHELDVQLMDRIVDKYDPFERKE
jgi:hypothetical protein